MPAQTTNQRIRYPDGDDTPDLTVIGRNLAEDLERLGVMRFTSAADRATRLPNPVAGMYSDLPDGLYRFTAGAWQPYPGRTVVSVQNSEPTYAVTNVYTDFTAAQWAPATVVVPASGTVRIEIAAEIGNVNTTTSSVRIAVRLSGAITQAPDGRSSLRIDGTKLGGGRPYYVFGLTPGAQLTVTPAWFITSGTTADISIGSGRLYVRPEG